MMRVAKILKNLCRLSIFKTLRFNTHYFGLKKGLKFPVLVSKNYQLHTLKGTVHINDYSFGNIRLGFNEVGIFDRRYDRGIWQNSGTVYLKGNCSFGHGSKLSNGGELIIGNNVTNTAKGEIVCQDKIVLGDNVLISWDTLIMDTDFHTITNNEGEILNPKKEISIGNHVWIGCRTMILKGVSVPDDCVVAANSTITKSFYDNNILIGGTNKVLKTAIKWKDE